MAFIQIPIVFGTAPITALVAGTGINVSAGPTPTIDLEDTLVTPGSYTAADITVDQQGRITAAANGTGVGTVTSVGSGTGLTGGPITTTGTLNLANTAVTPAAYTYADITVDQQGRITSAASGNPFSTILFGDGSDGDVTLGSNTTLTRDMYYNNLNLGGFTLTVGGYRVFIAGTLSGSGTITASGANASGSTAGAGAATGTIGGGGNGGNGGAVSGNGAAGTGVPATTWIGQAAGAGGLGAAVFTGGAAGTSTRPAAGQGGMASGGTNFGPFCSPITGHTGRDLLGTAMRGGNGAGGGGGSNTNAGGGGGGGGGVLMLFINANTSSVTFRANGGNGANATGTNAAGGGGGGGGYVYLVYNSLGWAPSGGTTEANGGNQGTGNGTGAAGTAGTQGVTHVIPIS